MKPPLFEHGQLNEDYFIMSRKYDNETWWYCVTYKNNLENIYMSENQLKFRLED